MHTKAPATVGDVDELEDNVCAGPNAPVPARHDTHAFFRIRIPRHLESHRASYFLGCSVSQESFLNGGYTDPRSTAPPSRGQQTLPLDRMC
jgi:hypothetical protein